MRTLHTRLSDHYLRTALRQALGAGRGHGLWKVYTELLDTEISVAAECGDTDETFADPASCGLARSAHSGVAFYYVSNREKFLEAVAAKHGQEAVLAALLELET